MRVTFALLSPTFGMHQYTAHLAARASAELGLRTRVVTTRAAPAERYGRDTELLAAVDCRTTGFAREAVNPRGYRAALAALPAAAEGGPVHFTGVHLWNVALVRGLLRRGVPVIHTLHDLAPHSDARRGALIRVWNRLLLASGATILVHADCYRRALLAQGVPPERVRSAPLTHGFLSAEAEAAADLRAGCARSEDRAEPVVLFFGRVEQYKGSDTLVEAWRIARARGLSRGRLIIAGRVAPRVTLPPLPAKAELRDRRIADDEALDLFSRAALLVLPYRDATQSALVAAAARFGVPAVVTAAGALPEYVTAGETGWIVPPDHPAALADALCEALSDESRLRMMGEAARARRLGMLKTELSVLASLYAAQTARGPDPADEAARG